MVKFLLQYGQCIPGFVEKRKLGYDGHCTHMEKVGGDLIFVNFLKKELLVVDASSLLDAV